MHGFLCRLTGLLPNRPRPQRRPSLRLEVLEERATPTVASTNVIAVNQGGIQPAAGTGLPPGLSPALVRHAYGIDQITFQNGAVAGDGSGQTIAIVDAYDQPNIAADLATFDATYGLAAPPQFTKVNQTGGTAMPAANADWGMEITLDVEWAHAVAPGANILLVETNSANGADLIAGENFARNQPGVSVVSMSWAAGEFSGESYYDSYFTTPSGHTGVTFVAASGDTGSTGAPDWPSVSPNVVAVGGTQLSVGTGGAYAGETAWSGSSGGLSVNEAQPGYQKGVVTQSATQRAVPDVAYDASTASPFAVYDSSSGGWMEVGGTSAGAPQWAALVAIADQGRVLAGKGTLDGGSQTLPLLYGLPASDFHDVTTGNDGGYSAGPGFDLVTGRGTPVANLVVAGLAGTTASTAPPFGGGPIPKDLVFTTEPDHSLWADDPSTNQWAMLSPAGTILAISASKDASGANEVFALGSDHSLWLYTTAGWSMLSPAGIVNGVSASPSNVVFIDASDASLWEHTAAGWAMLSPPGTVLAASAGTDASGAAEVFAVGSDHSLWRWDRGWQLLSPAGTIAGVSAVADNAFAVASDGSLWQHTSAGWADLSPAGTILAVSAGTDAAGNAAVFALASDDSLWRFTAKQGWISLSASNTVQSITNDQGPDLFVMGVDGVQWEFDGSAWSQVMLS